LESLDRERTIALFFVSDCQQVLKKNVKPLSFFIGLAFLMVLFRQETGFSQLTPTKPNWSQPVSPRVNQPISGNVYQNNIAPVTEASPENIMIILDASGSMTDEIEDGKRESKMDAAKRTVLEVIKNIPSSTRVGLRVYGNAKHSFFSCRSTEVMTPLGINNRYGIASQMLKIKPVGMTPISYTISKSLEEDFYGVTGEKSIILISDGIESCDEDPCGVAVRMQQRGINVKINVIGLGLTDYAAVKQLRCVALSTKAQFYTANTSAELAQSLNKAMQVKTTVQGTILKMPTSAQQNSLPANNTPSSNMPKTLPKVSQPKNEPLLEAEPSKKKVR
jgi:hypothetical protein